MHLGSILDDLVTPTVKQPVLLLNLVPIAQVDVDKQADMNSFQRLVGTHSDANGFFTADRGEFNSERQIVVLKLYEFPLEDFADDLELTYGVLFISIFIHFVYGLLLYFQSVFLDEEIEESWQPLPGWFESQSKVFEKFLRTDDAAPLSLRQSVGCIAIEGILGKYFDVVDVGPVPDLVKSPLSFLFLDILIELLILLGRCVGEFLNGLVVLGGKEGFKEVDDLKDPSFKGCRISDFDLLQFLEGKVLLVVVEGNVFLGDKLCDAVV